VHTLGLDDKIQMLEKSLDFLSSTGIRIHDRDTIEFLKAKGCQTIDDRVLFPRPISKDCLKKAAKPIEIFTYNADPAMILKPGNTYFGPGPTLRDQIDLYSGELRPSVLDDVRLNARLVSTLKNYDFMMSMASPSEEIYQKTSAHPIMFGEMVKYSSKPIVTTMLGLDDLIKIHKISKIVGIIDKPFYINLHHPDSPMTIGSESASMLRYSARHNIPFIYSGSSDLGSTGPVIPRWAFLQGHMESLAGIFIAILENKDSKCIYGSLVAGFDMLKGLGTYARPEFNKTSAWAAQMAEFMGLPSWGTGGCTDSKGPDIMAGMEMYAGIYIALLSKQTLVHDVGYMNNGFLNDSRLHVLFDMLIGRARHEMGDQETSIEEGLNEIEELLINNGNTYMNNDSTAYHVRSNWHPPKWLDRDNVMLSCQKQAIDLIKTNVPMPIDKDKEAQINQVLYGINGKLKKTDVDLTG